MLLYLPSPLGISFFFGQLVTMDAKAALFDNPPHTNGNIRIQGSFHTIRPHRVPPVKLADVIRTGRHAISATEAAGVNLADDSGIHVIVCRSCRAYRYTR